MTTNMKKTNLRNRQIEVNQKITANGFNDDLLFKQVMINQKRNKYNIADDEEKIFEEFVQ